MGMAIGIATRGVIIFGGGYARATHVDPPTLETVVLAPKMQDANVLVPDIVSVEEQSSDYTPTMISAESLEPDTVSTTELRPVIISVEEDS